MVTCCMVLGYQARCTFSYVAVSGYRCDMYNRALCDWRRIEINRPNDSGQGKTKQRRIEVVWLLW